MPRTKSTHTAQEHLNLSVIVGRIARPVEERSLPSGASLAVLEVTVDGAAGERSEAVPVTWFDPPAELATFGAGVEVFVIGRVRRHFFRSGGATQSRTDVTAEVVLPLSRRAAVERATESALERLRPKPK